MESFDYTKSLIDENQKLKELSPLEKFMNYRNLSKAEMPDRDRCPLAIRAYQELNWLNDEDGQEPDTFFASPYAHLRLMCKKHDREHENNNFYEIDFKRYIVEDKKLNYERLTDNGAKDYRYLWFCEPSTIQHYSVFLKEPRVLSYISAAHTIGSFHIIPRGFGFQPKCRWLLDDGIRSLKVMEENWDSVKKSYGNISFEEYRNKYFLNDAYEDGRLNEVKLKINFDSSWEELFIITNNLTNFIHKRTDLIIGAMRSIQRMNC